MYSETSQDIDLARFYKGFARYRKLGIIVFLAVLTIGVFGNTAIFPDTYEAKTTIRFKPLAIEDQRTPIHVLREEVLGRSILEKVINDLNLASVDQERKTPVQNIFSLAGIETKKKEVNIDSLVNWLSESVFIEAAQSTGNPDMFIMYLADENPELVTDIVNNIAQTYIANKRTYKREELEHNVKFLNSQVAAKKKEIDTVQSTLLRFRDLNADIISNVESLADDLRVARTNLVNSKSALLQAETALKNSRIQLSGINPTVTGGPEPVSEENLSPEELYYRVKTELDSLRFRFTPNHPLVRKSKNKLALLEKRVGKNPIIKTSSATNPEYSRIQSEVYAHEAEYIAAKSQVGEYKAEINRLESYSNVAPGISAKMANLNTKIETLHGEYDALKARLIDASIILNATEKDDIGSNFTVVDKASVPSIPVFGNRMKYYTMGIILAVLAGFGSVIGMVVITGKSTEQLVAETLAIKASSRLLQSFGFYLISFVILLANVGYIVSESIMQSIVII